MDDAGQHAPLWNKFFAPQTEEKANPIAAPMATAAIGLHHNAQPEPPVVELNKYSPNPAAPPRVTEMRVFIEYSRAGQNSMIILMSEDRCQARRRV